MPLHSPDDDPYGTAHDGTACNDCGQPATGHLCDECADARDAHTEALQYPLYPPSPVPAVNGRDAYAYGIALLLYVLQMQPVEVYGLLSDSQLELTLHCSQYAITARDILPLAVDRLSAVRTRLAAVLASRMVLVQASTSTSTPTANPADRPNTGPMARLQPTPYSRPPAGGKVQVDF